MLHPIGTDEALDLCVTALMDELLKREGLAPVKVYGAELGIPYRVKILPGNDRLLEIGVASAFRVPYNPSYTTVFELLLPPLSGLPGTALAYESMLQTVRLEGIRFEYRFTPAYELTEVMGFVKMAYAQFVAKPMNQDGLWHLRNILAKYR